MARVDQVIEDARNAKQQKQTTVTQINKAAPGVKGISKTQPVQNALKAAVENRQNAIQSSSKNVQGLSKTPTASIQKAVNNINKKKKQQETLKTTKPQGGLDNALTDVIKGMNLRPKEETDKEIRDVDLQLNAIYNDYLSHPETEALEKRRRELENERKLQEEKTKRVTVPSYQQAYEEAMKKGDKQSAEEIARIIDAYDDNLFEKTAKTGIASFLNATNNLTLSAWDTLKDNAYKMSQQNMKDLADQAREEGNEYLARQYEQVGDYLKETGDKFDVNDPNNWAVKIRDEMMTNLQLAQINASPSEKLLLDVDQSIMNMMPTILSTTGLPGMFVQVLSSTYAQNKAEGYDDEVALGNAALHAANEVLWEIISPVSNVMQSSAVMNNAIGKTMAMMVGDPLGEAAEEVGTALLEPLIDKFTLGKELEYNCGEIVMAGVMGALTSEAMNAPVQIHSFVQTTRQVNQIKAEMNILDQIANRPENIKDVDLQNGISMAKRHAQNLIDEFNSRSVLGQAISLESEQVRIPNVQQMLDSYNAFMQPTNNRYDQRVQQSLANLENLQQEYLDENGINMSAREYALLDTDTQKAVQKVAGYANQLGVELKFDSKIGETGYFDSKTGQIVINPHSNLAPITTFAHELTHNNEKSQFYQNIRDILLNETTTEDLQKSLDYIQGEYEKAGHPVDTDGAMREYVAIELQNKLGNEKFMKQLVSHNSSLAYRLYEGLKDTFTYSDDTRKIERNFEKAFRDVQKNPLRDTDYAALDSELGLQYATGNTVSELFGKINQEDTERIKRIAPRSFDNNGNLLSFKQQVNDMMADPSSYPYGVIPLGASLSEYGVNEELYFTPSKMRTLLNHYTLEELDQIVNSIPATAVAGSKHSNGNSKEIYLLKDGKYFALRLKKTLSHNRYSIDSLVSINRYKDIAEHIEKAAKYNDSFYKKSDPFLRGVLASNESLFKEIASNYIVPNESENLKPIPFTNTEYQKRGMSKNAIEAYSKGFITLNDITEAQLNQFNELIGNGKERVNSIEELKGIIQQYDTRGEYHHVGENADPTGFYDLNQIADNYLNGRKKYSAGIENLRPDGSRKDLRAQHNLSAENLERSMDMGGFIMPSVAVTKDSIPFEQYGDISIVFDKDTIDPSKQDNKVFTRDAWTPTFPAAEYKLSNKAYKIKDAIENLVSKSVDPRSIQSIMVDDGNFNDMMARNKGSIADSYKGSLAMKIAYLNDTGDTYQMPTKGGNLGALSKKPDNFIRKSAEALKNYDLSKFDYYSDVDSEIEEKLSKLYHDYLYDDYYNRIKEKPNHPLYKNGTIEERAEKLASTSMEHTWTPFSPRDVVNDVKRYLERGEYEVPDIDKAKEELSYLENDENFHKWIEKTMDGIIEKKGIRNQKETFTKSGNRRSFEALHDPYTSEGILKNMKEQENTDSFFGYDNFNYFLGVTSDNFNDVQDIIDREGSLQTNDNSEQYDALMQRYADFMSNLRNQRRGGDVFWDIVSLEGVMDEAVKKIKRNSSTESVIKTFKDYNFNVTSDTVNELRNIIKDGRALTTDYFEAKPRRIVRPNEWKQAYVPNTTDPNLIQRLKDMGVETIEYDPNIPGDRQAKMNGESGTKRYQFSIGISDSQGRELSPEQREYFKDTKAVDDNGNLLPMYHGTMRGGFSIFDPSFSDDKRSLFFTDDPGTAESYTRGGYGSIYPVYLNLKNPMVIDAKGASWNQIQNGEIKNLVANRNTIGDFTFLNEEDANSFEQKYHIQELTNLLEEAEKNGFVEYNGETYDEWDIGSLLDDAKYKAEREYRKYHQNNSKSITIKEFLDNYKDYGWYDLESLQDTYDDNGLSLLEIKEYADNDYDKAVQSYIDFFKNEIEEGNTDSSVYDISFDALPKSGESFEKKDLHNTRWFSEQAQKQGYDGVIFKNLIDRVYGNGASTVAIAFDSNQVKSVFNKNPTSNKDIRYSVGIQYDDFAPQENFASEGLTDAKTKRLKRRYKTQKGIVETEGNIPAQARRIIQNFYNDFDSRYSTDLQQFSVMYDDVADYLLDAANEAVNTGGFSRETLDNLHRVLKDGAEEVYNFGDRPDNDNVTNKVKDVLKKHPLSNSVLKEYDLSKSVKEEMKRNGIKFSKDGMDLGQLAYSFEDAGLKDNFDSRTFSDLEDFNKTLSDLYNANENKELHKSQEFSENENAEEEFDDFFNEKMKDFYSKVTGKQILSQKTADIIDSIDEREFDRFVKRNPISPRTLETIEKNRKALIESAKEWIPNYDIIEEKYPGFKDTDLSNALFDILSTGKVSESTEQRIKDYLVQGVDPDFTNYDQADKYLKEMVDDALTYFSADAAYKMNKKAMDSVANKANTILRSFAGFNDPGIGYLDTWKNMDKLQKTLESVKKRREAVAADNEAMVAKLLESGKDHGSNWKTLEQNLDTIAGTNSELRQTLRDYFELPKYESQLSYASFKKHYGDILQGLVNDGIRAGTKESAAVQYLMEGAREDGSVYTQADLMKEFPDNWQKIEKAAKTLREMYDEMYKLIEENRERIYGDFDAKFELQLAKAREKANVAQETVRKIENQLRQKADPRLQAALNRARAEANKLQRQVDQMTTDKLTGDATRRQKLQYRENYAHHIRESGGFISQMRDALSSERKIPTKLSGISDRAKPLSGFASFFMRRNNGSYTPDAIGGMAEYINDASRIYAYDPYVEYLRWAANDIRAEASGNQMSRFVKWIDDYANGIAGKTQSLDRGFNDLSNEKVYKVVKALNNAARRNAVTGNLSTALVQFANLPNALGVLSQNGGANSTLDIARGIAQYVSNIGQDGLTENSPFMTARYFDIDTKKGNILTQNARNMVSTLLEFGDKEAAKMIWNSAYQQALRKGEADPIMYADDLTRRSIAGRSVGELPLAMQSEFLKLAMPFQVETNNTLQLMKGLGRDKEIGALIAMLLGGWLMNGLYEAILGRRPIVDPIDAIVDGVKDGGNIADVGLRLSGELLSAVPVGSYVPGLLGWDDNTRRELFGENDPSRYGTGNIGMATIGSAIRDVKKAYDNKDPRYAMNAVSDLASTYLAPVGGRQIQRTVEGLQSEGILPQYVNGEWKKEPAYFTQSGKTGFVNDPSNIFEVIQSGAFGRWTTKEAREYLENGNRYLSDTSQRQYEALSDSLGASDAYQAAKQLRQFEHLKDADGNTIPNSQAAQRRKYLEDIGAWDAFAEAMGEDYQSYGITKTVATTDDFESLYKDIMSQVSNEEPSFDSAYAEAMTPKTESEAEQKPKENKADFSAYNKTGYGFAYNDDTFSTYAEEMGLNEKETYALKEAAATSEGKKENGKTVRNSRALEVRHKYEEAGVYDDVIKYMEANGLNPGDVGLNKTVVGMSDSQAESKYQSMFNNAYAETFSGRKSSGSTGRVNKRSASFFNMTFDQQKAYFDKLVSQVGAKNAKSQITNIMNKVRKTKTKKFRVEGMDKLIKSYLRDHPGTDRSMFE